MKIFPTKVLSITLFLALASCLSATPMWAATPIPSQWRGEITGQVHNTKFRLPVSIEIKPPLPFENNPLNIFVGAGNPTDIGHLFLASAMKFNTSRGPVTLQYLSISIRQTRLQARLTDHHGAEAAKGNGFSGPNVSAEQASDLMKDVLRNAWGSAEMFGFNVGATLVIDFSGNRLSGTVQGLGSSYTGTTSGVAYGARMTATRVK